VPVEPALSVGSDVTAAALTVGAAAMVGAGRGDGAPEPEPETGAVAATAATGTSRAVASTVLSAATLASERIGMTDAMDVDPPPPAR
jgi:tartrate dehydratase beta subunit/fumarate hydratase class I family protein